MTEVIDARASSRLREMPEPDDISGLLSLLPELEADIAAGERRLRECVRQLRMQRATWREIGDALQVSRQAAWERFRSI